MYSITTETYRNIDASQLPINGNLVNYSVLRDLERVVPFKRFSVKYVIEGCEKYTVNGKKFHLAKGQYLLANCFAEGSIKIDSPKPVKGICIELSMDILSEVVASYRRPDTAIADLALDKFFSTPEFLENQYNAAQTSTGKLLLDLDARLSKNPFHAHEFNHEFFYQLAEHLVIDNANLCQQIKAISSVKLATKKDLIRKLNTGKAFMDTNFSLPMDIAMIAKEAGLSPYHFFRLFKTVYGKSPYQYLLHKRLNSTLVKIQNGNDSLTEIAMNTGFSDIHSFSKTFKKHFGIAPSEYSKTEIARMATVHQAA